MHNNISRRKFILIGGALTSGTLVDLKYNTLIGGSLTNSDQVNVGFIGMGSRGTFELKIAQSLSGIKVIACCDILPTNLERALKFSNKGARGYTDYRKLLDNKDIDAVVIATPLNLHSQMALDAIAAGKHIYCEKTMAYNIDETIHLAEKVNQSKLIFQVGYQQRANLFFHKIHSFISNGYCGKITHISCNWDRNGNWRRPVSNPKLERLINWRMYKEYSGGLMAELCSHQIDIVNWMLGAHPEKVVGFGGIDYWKDGRETYDNVNAVFEYPDGVKVQFTSLTTNAHDGFSMKFYGTKATIEVNIEQEQQAFIYPERTNKTTELRIDGLTGPTTESSFGPNEGIPIKMDDQPQNDLTYTGNAFKSFADCIRENRIPAADIKAGKASAISVHMANKAMHNNSVEYWKKEYSM